MRFNVQIHEPATTNRLPIREHVGRRRRAQTELPAALPNPRPQPTPVVPLGRKSTDTRFVDPDFPLF